MQTCIVFKQYTPEELQRKWSKRAWKDTPAQIVAIPSPAGVLFGAEKRDTVQRVSFFLTPEDARIIGQKLLNAAWEAQNAAS